MIAWLPVKVPAVKRPFAIMISWFRSTGSGAKETLCHHDFLVPVKVLALKRPFAILISRVSVYTGSGGEETLCDHDFLGSGKKGPALKRRFAIIISWVPVEVRVKRFRHVSALKRGFCHHDFLGSDKKVPAVKETLCHHDFLVPVKWYGPSSTESHTESPLSKKFIRL
jgi:hypothetical protein